MLRSVGGTQSLLPARLTASESGLHWNLLHCPDGFHPRSSRLLFDRGRQDSAGKGCEDLGRSFCFRVRDARLHTLGNLMCSEVLFFNFPMGDTSRFFRKKSDLR